MRHTHAQLAPCQLSLTPNILSLNARKAQDLGRVQFSSVPQLCPTLCDPMDCSTPAFPVYHLLAEFIQTHVLEPSEHLIFCRPLLPLPSIFPSIRVSSNKSVLHIKWPQYWSFSFSISPSNEYDGLVGHPYCPRDSQEYSPTLQFKNINFSALSFLYSPTLTLIHDYWKNHSFD